MTRKITILSKAMILFLLNGATGAEDTHQQ